MQRVALVIALIVGLPVGLGAQEKEVLRVRGAVPGLPFSPVIKVGNMLYLSGQLGNRVGTRELVPGGITAETRQTLDNIRELLESAGSSLSRVVKCTVFLADIADYGKMNEVYASYFSPDPPARSTIAGSGLALGARVEIECMAVAGP